MADSKSTPVHNPTIHDPVIKQLYDKATDNMFREIAQRIRASEPGEPGAETLPPQGGVISILLSHLVRPRVTNGVTHTCVVRITRAGRCQEDRHTQFQYFESVGKALEVWPVARMWPYPYRAPDDRTPKMGGGFVRPTVEAPR